MAEARRSIFYCPKCKRPHGWRASSAGKSRACECGEIIAVPSLADESSFNGTIAAANNNTSMDATRAGTVAGATSVGASKPAGSIAGATQASRNASADTQAPLDRKAIREQLREVLEATAPKPIAPAAPPIKPAPREKGGIDPAPIPPISIGNKELGGWQATLAPLKPAAPPLPPSPPSPAKISQAVVVTMEPIAPDIPLEPELNPAPEPAPSGQAPEIAKALAASASEQAERHAKKQARELKLSNIRDWLAPGLCLLVGLGVDVFEIARRLHAANELTFLGSGLRLYLAANAIAVAVGIVLSRLLLQADFGRIGPGILKALAVAAITPAIWAGIIEGYFLLHRGGDLRAYYGMGLGALFELGAFYAIFANLFSLDHLDQVFTVAGMTLIKLVLFVAGFVVFNISAATHDVHINVPITGVADSSPIDISPAALIAGTGGSGGIPKSPPGGERAVAGIGAGDVTTHDPPDKGGGPGGAPQLPSVAADGQPVSSTQGPPPGITDADIARAMPQSPADLRAQVKNMVDALSRIRVAPSTQPATMPTTLPAEVIAEAKKTLENLQRMQEPHSPDSVKEAREMLQDLQKALASAKDTAKPAADSKGPSQPESPADVLNQLDKLAQELNADLLPSVAARERYDVIAKVLPLAPKIARPGMTVDNSWPTVSFRYDIQPLLTRAGCNSGACHAKPGEESLMALSVRGFDDQADWQTITRRALGRRIDLATPSRSLLVLKATGGIRHAGGKAFAFDSPEAKTLTAWIAAGAPGPRATDPRLLSLTVLPSGATLAQGESVRLRAIARFSDGRALDVSARARFGIDDTAVAATSIDGLVSATGHGEAIATAIYRGQSAQARLLVPYDGTQMAAEIARAPARNFIDYYSLETLRNVNLSPSPTCSDSEFIRRAFIATIGALPTADESREFLTDTTLFKRDQLIEKLLNRPAFTDYWTRQWMNLLQADAVNSSGEAAASLYAWLRPQISENVSWISLSAKLLAANGNMKGNGAAAFYVMHPGASRAVAAVGRSFLGRAVRCARCHDDPSDNITREQYGALADLFSDIRIKSDADDVVVLNVSEETRGLPSRRVGTLPLGLTLANVATRSRPAQLAAALSAGDNRILARAITARIWSNFIGGRFDDPADAPGAIRSASDSLLSQLSNYFVENGGDARATMRVILRSETFQRSGNVTGNNADDAKLYSHYPRPLLSGEAILDAFCQASGASLSLPGYRAGTRIMQTPDRLADSDFLRLTSLPAPRASGCERLEVEPAGIQKPYTIRAAAVRKLLKVDGSLLTRLFAAHTPPRKIVDELYLAALSRRATGVEMVAAQKALEMASDSERQAVAEQLYWNILASDAFVHNR